MRSFLALLILFSTVPVSAEDAKSSACPSINLYENVSSPFHRMPIYDQGELYTCYAHTASQMIDYWRFSHDPNATDLTNPLWTALIHKSHVGLHWNPDDVDFSRMKWVFKDLEDHGICKGDVVRSSIDKLRNGNAALTDEDIIFFFQSLWNEYESLRHGIARRNFAYKRAYEKVSTNDYFKNKIVNSLYEKFKFISHRTEKGRLEALMKDVFSECKGQNIIHLDHLPDRQISGTGFASNAKIERKIREVLNQKIPMGIGYCYDVLTKGPSHKGIYVYPRMLGMILNPSGCEAHYSMVVGSRPSLKEKDSCEYLIRNTYGTGFWTDKLTCYCQSTDKEAPGFRDCKASDTLTQPLKVLGCWIGGKELATNTFDLTNFKVN